LIRSLAVPPRELISKLTSNFVAGPNAFGA
jgi:hypothetical protein